MQSIDGFYALFHLAVGTLALERYNVSLEDLYERLGGADMLESLSRDAFELYGACPDFTTLEEYVRGELDMRLSEDAFDFEGVEIGPGDLEEILAFKSSITD